MSSLAFSARDIDKVMTVVNDAAITQYDYDVFYQATLAMTPDRYRDQAANDLKQHQMDLMVNQALVLAIAENQHVEVTDKMVDDLEANIQSGLELDEMSFLEHLQAFNLTEDQFRNHLKNGLTASLVQQNVIKSLVTITPAMVQQHIKQNQDEESRYVFNDYRIKTDGLTEKDQAKMADKLAKEITANTRIPEDVKPYVERTPFVDVKKSSMPQVFMKKLVNAKPPEVIKAFKIANGYHVIWYRDKKQPTPLSQEQAMAAIGAPKAEAAFTKWIKELRESAYIHQFS